MNNLYFIALIPPPKICAEVSAFKEYIAKRHNSKKALRVIPHITLKAPFTLSSLRDNEVRRWFASTTPNLPPFIVQLDGFGAFDNPANPVLFVKPTINEGMKILQRNIITGFTEKFPEIPVHFHEHEFHPHMTVAYRDLTYDAFKKAWPEFQHKEFTASWECNSFCLLKHDGNMWQVMEENYL